MTAEFFGLEPDPGPKHFIKADGPRKLVVQIGVTDDLVLEDRQDRMSTLAARAVGVFAYSGLRVDWHTLTFSVTRSGMELSPDSEMWRWEVWAR